ncbi:cytochrome P450 [Ganoderma sinense ZZ0214-1]|uniref:Cytochrome P450 n=1 Tax=Ganoderma sinense ZZ0214-1 TaxID=1077348 RepID=A0A2G8SF63_9APHY|nr:cytochrome P450 [Ganoderma sinense ZZ0214-1]
MRSNPISEYQACLYAAPCLALAIWGAILHRYTLRGDFIVLGHAIGFTAIYYALSASASALSNIALKTSAEIGIVYTLTLILITLAHRLSPWHPLASYPGPPLARTTSLWLTYISYTGKRYLILDALHARYGPFLRVGPNTLSINSPNAVPIYVCAEKSEMYRLPGHYDASGLFFKQDKPDLERRTVQLLKTLEERQSRTKDGFVEMSEPMYHWAHDFTGDMVFGGCNKYELMKNGDKRSIVGTGKRAMAMMDSLGQSPWLLDILWHLPFTARMRRHGDHAIEMMHKRVEAVDLPGYRDLASYLIDGGVSGLDLDADAVVAIVGGSDNTSITVTFAMYFLLATPEFYLRLRKELDAAFPDPAVPLSLNKLAELGFLDGVINETLRLASPYFNPRVIGRGGSVVDGRYIPEGTVVALAAHSQQVSPDNFYPSPQEFLPDRWLPDGLGPETKTNKAMLASFSYGAHSCIGKVLAYHQMRLALARLLLAFDFELQKGFDVAGFRSGILNMRTMFLEKELYVRVTRRPGVDLDALTEAVA